LHTEAAPAIRSALPAIRLTPVSCSGHTVAPVKPTPAVKTGPITPASRSGSDDQFCSSGSCFAAPTSSAIVQASSGHPAAPASPNQVGATASGGILLGQ
jgi:hypothetical protein